jgi:ComF family protein
MIHLLLELMGALVSPEKCAACDARVSPQTIFCASCVATVEAATRDVDTYAPFRYGGALAEAIVRFKYQRRGDLARPLGALLLRALPQLRSRKIDLVIPVPLHPSRLAERGFNQAALLARPMAAAIGAPLLARGLERVRDTPRQATLDRILRLENVATAFVARDAEKISAKHILLVDDVRTTGATLRACASALRNAGAARVYDIALAVADN